MCHIQLLKNHCGKIIRCKQCNNMWDTQEVVSSVLTELFLLSKIEYPLYWPQDLQFPFTHEQLEVLASLYQNDMISIPEDKEHTRRFMESVDWTMMKVLIIDEISMAEKKMFKLLDKNLRILTGNKRELYGGIHIIFTGDSCAGNNYV